nr:DNA polymerase zeta catalytic subunit [Onthophagus taurus]
MLVRVVNVDFYMHPPISNLDPLYSEFRGSAIHQVPILRIFGSTDAGVKTCLHIHGVFPYIYIPYDGQEGVDSFIYQLAASLDKAINVSLGQTASNIQHIFKITLVSGIPFYGYHPKHHQFLKLYFYNPLILKKACALLQNGSIMGRIFQPHEAHIPYILQFMIDYNLYGMSFINVSEVKYRSNIDLIDIPEELILPSTIQKMSTCKLEIDGLAENILNRSEVNSQSLGLNPGIQALWDDEKQRRRNVGDNSLVEHCLTQNRVDIEPTATHLAYLNALKEKLKKPSKNEDNEDKQNLSVYPAETPKDNTKKILNASTIESHIYNSQSSDSTFLDFTITPEETEANLSLDRDAKEFLEILGDLRENIESDSILSQALPERESDDEEKEDLSIPLPYIKTPVKSDEQNLDQSDADLDECYFDLSLSIPQLDGADDLTPTKRVTRKKAIECCSIGAGGGSSSKEECQQLDQMSSMCNNNLSLNQSASKEIASKLYKNILDMLQTSSKRESISTISKLKTNLLHLLSKVEENQLQNKDVLEALTNSTETIENESVNRDMKLRNGRAINFNELNVRKRSSTKSRQKNQEPSSSSSVEATQFKCSDKNGIKGLNELDLSTESLNKRVLELSDLHNDLLNLVSQAEMNQISKNTDLDELNLSIESQNKESDLVKKLRSDELPQLKVQLNDFSRNYKQPLPQRFTLVCKDLNATKIEEMNLKNLSDTNISEEISDFSIINGEESNVGIIKKRGKGRPAKKNKKSLAFKYKLKSINETCTSNSSFDPDQNEKRNNSVNESDLFLSSATESTVTGDHSEINSLNLSDLPCINSKKRGRRPTKKKSNLAHQRCVTSTPSLKSLEMLDLSGCDDGEEMKRNSRNIQPTLNYCVDEIINLDEDPSLSEIKDQDVGIPRSEKEMQINLTFSDTNIKTVDINENTPRRCESEIEISSNNSCEILLNESKENSLQIMFEPKGDEKKVTDISKNPILSIEGNPGMSTNINKPVRKRRVIKKRKGTKQANKKFLTKSNENCISMTDLQRNIDNDERVINDDENFESLRKSKRIRRGNSESTISPRYITRSRTSGLTSNTSNRINNASLNESQNVTDEKIVSKDFCIENDDLDIVVNDLNISITDTEILQNTNLIEIKVKSPKLSEINEIPILELSSSDDNVIAINQAETVPSDNSVRKSVGLSMPSLNLNSSIIEHKEEKKCNTSKSSCVKSKINEPTNNVVKEIDIFRDEDRYLRNYDKQKTIVRNRKRSLRLKGDKKTEILSTTDTLTSEKKPLKRKLTDESEQKIKNHSVTKKTIPITVHVPLLEDSFCKSPTVSNKINNPCFTYSTGLYPSQKFKVVESNNRPYSYLPKTNVATLQHKENNFPNTNWNDLNPNNPPKKQIIMHSCTVLDENQRIDINTLPLKKTYNMRQSSVFPRNNQSTHSGNYSMSDFSDFQRLVLEEFENCYEENKSINENDITFEKNVEKVHILQNQVEIKRGDNDDLNEREKVINEENIFINENKNGESLKFPGNTKVKSEALNKLEGTIDELIEIIKMATNNTKNILENNQISVKEENVGEKFTKNTRVADNVEASAVINHQMRKHINRDSKRTNIINGNNEICCETMKVEEKCNNQIKNLGEENKPRKEIKKIELTQNTSTVINHQMWECTGTKNSYKLLQAQGKCNNQIKNIGEGKMSNKEIKRIESPRKIQHTNENNLTMNYQQLWQRINKDSKKTDLTKNDNKSSYKMLKPQEKCNNQFKNVGEETLKKEVKKLESPQNKLLINKNNGLNKNSSTKKVYKRQFKPLEIPGNIDITKFIKKEAKISSRKPKDTSLTEIKLFGFATRTDIDDRLNYPRFKMFNYGRGNIKPNASSDKKPDLLKYPINQYAHFDGTNDSSSSDEDVITTVRKVTKPVASQSTSKYVPLKVKYTSPTKSVGKPALSRIQSQDKISNVKALTQSTLNTAASKQSLYKHRRKLSFTQVSENNLNTTHIEEHLSCRFKAQRSKVANEKVYIDCDSTTSSSSNSIGSDKEVLPIQLCQTTLDQDESLENDVNEIIEKSDGRAGGNRSDQEDVSSDDTLTPKKNNSNLNDSSLSDDLFSPASDEITICHKIDPAKQYDVENRFIPLAGSSKMDPQFKKLSQHSNHSSSSDVITPYQREQNIIIENVIESVVANNFSENSETSQEDVDKTKNETISSLHMNTDSVNEIISGKFEKLNTSILSVYKPTSQNLNKKNEKSLIITPKFNPPSREMIEKSLETYNIPEITHQEPFYSDRNDVTGNVEVGRKVLKIPSNNVVDLPSFKTNFEGIESQKKKTLQVLQVDNKKLSTKEILEYKLSTCKNCNVVITPGKLPPTRKEVEKWLKEKTIKKEVDEEKGKEKKRMFLVNSPGRDGEESCDSLSLSPCTPIDANSTIFKLDLNSDQNKFNDESKKSNNEINDQLKNTQTLPNSTILKSNDTVIKNLSSSTHSNSHEITGTTQNNFLVASHNLNEAKAVKENLYLTILSIEVVVITRNEYKPNPELDQIKAIIFTMYDNENISKGGFIINSLPTSPTKMKLSILKGIDSKYNLKPVNTELELINEFVEFVKEKDPDVFVGFEIEMLSWGYLIDRGYVLGLNLTISLSRTPDIARRKRGDDEELTITGRILIDFWRLLRHEIALTSYSFENIVYHILHRRIPLYSHKDLTNWLQHPTSVYRNRVIEYYSYKTRAVLQIMDQLDLIGRTSELAKLFGIQFYEVLSRGSQFRVESMMLRLAKPLNFIPVSPNQQQRAKMRAPESLPLIMEPESKFYTDPVIVLDFQSLYPSMIIAYNYCFSTCLGRIEHLGKSSPFEFGANQLKVSRKYLKYFLNKEKLNISPCGIAYVNKSIRLGILPRMLQEILDTRLMIKKSLKQNAENKVLSKVLDARQLGLKLIANVTYGYTAANFSGRMPCIELGDSVVSKGRETLQRAIQLVEKTSKWGAKVVYGDTDSLFVLVPGKSKECAFKIGAEIAEAVTNSNPSPVKLKLEKIFQPCILQTKKRYVGYMYESVDQKEPEFLAKGIETVRRDGCPASAKMLEKCLKLLFDTRDVSLIKKYVLRQFAKLLSGRVSIQDLTFAKEYRGASYYRPGACVPALELAKKWTSIDKRNEPRKGERVPYVIINGPPGQPLIKLVKSPRDLLNDSSIRINALYYITKAIIPPLNRCFLLIGADLNQWFNEMPRKQHQYLPTSTSPGKNKPKKNTITQFFSTLDCAICGALTQDGLCEKCKCNPQQSGLLLHEKVRLWEQHFFNTLQICQSCCGRQDEICCVSLDCPVYYRRIQTNRDLQQSGFIRQMLLMLPNLEF